MSVTERKLEKIEGETSYAGHDRFTLIFIGYPNAGKSSIFSIIARTEAHTGNFPGTTVEVKEATFKLGKRKFVAYDLPGLKSTAVDSEDQRIARNFLLESKDAVIFQIVDASNLEKDLYLTIELLELGIKPILVLNKMDLAEAKEIRIDIQKLSEELDLPIFTTVATRPKTLSGLIKFLEEEDLQKITERKHPELLVPYPKEIAEFLLLAESKLSKLVKERKIAKVMAVELLISEKKPNSKRGYRKRLGFRHGGGNGFRALAPLRRKQFRHRLGRKITIGFEAEENLAATCQSIILAELEEARSKLNQKCWDELGTSALVLVAEARHKLIREILAQTLSFPMPGKLSLREKLDDRLDKVLLHPILGPIIFLVGMWMVFEITFVIGSPLVELVGSIFTKLGGWAKAMLEQTPLLASLIGDGIFGGVGAVLSFTPLIVIFLFLATILEESGYMARGALLLDSIFRRFGLSGHCFVPMVISFGCNIPGVLATRTIPNPRQRVATIIALPLMSCSARLVVYLVIIGAFFEPKWAGTILFSLYALGILSALLLSLIFSKALGVKGRPVIVQLPNFQLPTVVQAFKGAWLHGRHYITKAGTIIFAVSVIMWALFALPPSYPKAEQQKSFAAEVVNPDQTFQGNDIAGSEEVLEKRKIEDSFGGRLGKAIEPIFRPLGFGWEIVVGLIAAGFAKEVLVSTLAVAYSAEGEDDAKVAEVIRQRSGLKPLNAFALMVFVLLYMPCLPTIVTMFRELGGIRWLSLGMALYLLLAYGLAYLSIFVGRLMGF